MDETKEYFQDLIDLYIHISIVFVASSHVTTCYDRTGTKRQRKEPSREFCVCYVTTYLANVLPSSIFLVEFWCFAVYVN